MFCAKVNLYVFSVRLIDLKLHTKLIKQSNIQTKLSVCAKKHISTKNISIAIRKYYETQYQWKSS